MLLISQDDSALAVPDFHLAAPDMSKSHSPIPPDAIGLDLDGLERALSHQRHLLEINGNRSAKIAVRRRATRRRRLLLLLLLLRLFHDDDDVYCCSSCSTTGLHERQRATPAILVQRGSQRSWPHHLQLVSIVHSLRRRSR